MNTYIKTNDSTEYAAVRASRRALVKSMPELKPHIVASTKTLRRLAYIGAIPTYEISINYSLVRM